MSENDPEVVKNRGGIWCFRGQHLVPQGSPYRHAADGATVCLEHQHDPPRPVVIPDPINDTWGPV